MKGFREFLLRGNLIELAVAFIIGAAFSSVVESFTALFIDLLGKLGGQPDFSSVSVAGIGVGAFLTALVSFVLTAAVVYFGVVLPYNKAKAFADRNKPVEEAAPTSEELLAQIRDELRAQRNS